MIGRATPPWVYAVVVVAVLAATFAVGWTVNGWRWEARHATAERTHADALAASQAEAMRLAAHLNRRVAGIDAARTKDLMEARRETDALRADLDAGRRRLRLAATCPAPVPTAPGAAGLGNGGAPELTADARAAYLDLRAGIDTVTAQLLACQDYARAVGE
ncbi:MAG: hypothetical protein VR70_03770 [Rhodospirillaceae bacterium BRH_c57]|nr:MAG: hypothetical protein VR70_03770 [Rhodospirillaceae bacterium BRH_c57]